MQPPSRTPIAFTLKNKGGSIYFQKNSILIMLSPGGWPGGTLNAKKQTYVS